MGGSAAGAEGHPIAGALPLHVHPCPLSPLRLLVLLLLSHLRPPEPDPMASGWRGPGRAPVGQGGKFVRGGATREPLSRGERDLGDGRAEGFVTLYFDMFAIGRAKASGRKIKSVGKRGVQSTACRERKCARGRGIGTAGPLCHFRGEGRGARRGAGDWAHLGDLHGALDHRLELGGRRVPVPHRLPRPAPRRSTDEMGVGGPPPQAQGTAWAHCERTRDQCLEGGTRSDGDIQQRVAARKNDFWLVQTK